jgi:hypothetical protein
MVAPLRLIWYLLRHKWYVLRASLALRVPLWQALIHDWSKFRPSELLPYARMVYGRVGWRRVDLTRLHYTPGHQHEFDTGINHHRNRNPHHWQYWLLYTGFYADESRPFTALPMPERFVREMVADWIGAARAQGNTNVYGWYTSHKEEIILHPATRVLVEQLLDEAHQRGLLP